MQARVFGRVLSGYWLFHFCISTVSLFDQIQPPAEIICQQWNPDKAGFLNLLKTGEFQRNDVKDG